MSHAQRNSLQSLHRTHSFINRTPHTVLNIVGKNSFKDIIHKMDKSITKNSNDKSNKNIMINSSNVRCLRIDQCQIQNKQEFIEVPPVIIHNLFNNLIKLAITKCNLLTMNIREESLSKKQKNRSSQQCLFPNLEEIDISQNRLKVIPLFVMKCKKLKKLSVNNNNLTKIDPHLRQLQNLKHITIFGNQMEQLAVSLLIWAKECGVKFDYQWKVDFLMASIDRILDNNQHKRQIQRTQGEEIEIAAEEITGQYSNKYREQLGEYIDIKQILSYIIERINMSDGIKQVIDQQYLQLLSYEHIEYLKYLQVYIKQKGENAIMKLVQKCVKERYYKSMDYLLSLRELLNYEITSKNKQIVKVKPLKQNKQSQKNKNTYIKQSNYAQIKEFQNQNVIVVGKKKIKMLNNKNPTKYKDKSKITTLQSPTSTYEITNKSNLTDRSYQSNSILNAEKSLKPNNFQLVIKQKQEISVKTKIKKATLLNTNSNQAREEQIVPSAQDPINSLNNSPKRIKSWFKARKTDDKQNEENESRLLMAKLVSYNINHIQSIPLDVLLDVNLDQFTWFLNQLQYVYKYHVKTKTITSKNNPHISTSYLRSVFKSKSIKIIANNLITNSSLLEYILNSVSYKLSIKLLLTECNLQYLEYYEFSSSSVIKTLLLLDDYQLFCFFTRSYKNFVESLFGNYFTKYLQYNMVDMVPIAKSVALQNEQALLKSQINKNYFKWQQIVRPQSKLYKILYKKQKQYTRRYLKQNNSKNWHFPQYVPPQTFIIRNDIHDDQVLKEYEEFQSSFQSRDLKLQIRSNFNNKDKCNHFSIAKKIYMDVVEQINGLVRNIGKSKNKSKKFSQNDTIKSQSYHGESFMGSNTKIKTSGSMSTNLLPSSIVQNRLNSISISINTTDLNKTMKPALSKSIDDIQFFTKTFSNCKKQQNKQNLCFKKESLQAQRKKSSILIKNKSKQTDEEIKSIGKKSKKKKGIIIMGNSSQKNNSMSHSLRKSNIQLTPFQKILKQNKKQLQLTQKRTIYLDLNSASNNRGNLIKADPKTNSKNGWMGFDVGHQEEQIEQVQCSTFDV